MVGIDRLSRILDGVERYFGKLRLDLQTNGTLIDDRAAREISERFSIVMISLSAFSEDRYEIIHGSRDFGRVLDAISKLAGRVYLSARFVYLPGVNEEDLIELLQRSENLGLDEVFVQPCTILPSNHRRLISLGARIREIRNISGFLERFLELREEFGDIIRTRGCLLTNYEMGGEGISASITSPLLSREPRISREKILGLEDLLDEDPI